MNTEENVNIAFNLLEKFGLNNIIPKHFLGSEICISNYYMLRFISLTSEAIVGFFL